MIEKLDGSYTVFHVRHGTARHQSGGSVMRTFAQYAATRLLREHPARTLTFGGVAVGAGAIQTFAGVDLITGMPVMIYTMPERPAPIPQVYSDSIPATLELGFEHELGYVVTASAPGFTPLRATLSKSRLEWLARVSALALSDAHAAGLHHGNLEPAHFLASSDQLMLEGWGLPWGDAEADYRAPEGGTSAAADVFAWARSLQALGRGNPRLMLNSEMGRWIAHGLNPKPQDRPTAQEMVMALEKLLKREAAPSTTEPIVSSNPASSNLALSSPVLSSEEKLRDLEQQLALELPPLEDTRITLAPSTALEVAVPLPLEPVVVTPTPVPLEEAHQPLPLRVESPIETRADASSPIFAADPAQLFEPEHLAADEPDVQLRPVRESEFDAEAPEPGLLARRDSSLIRIGFEQDDDSWRQVVRPQDAARSAQRRFIPVLLAAIAIACALGLVWLLRPQGIATGGSAGVTPLTVPGDPVAGTVVNFKFSRATPVSGRLSIVTAPAAAKLTPGSVLASVPGPVLFSAAGTYRLSVAVDGFKPVQISLTVPGLTEFVLELPQQ